MGKSSCKESIVASILCPSQIRYLLPIVYKCLFDTANHLPFSVSNTSNRFWKPEKGIEMAAYFHGDFLGRFPAASFPANE